MGEPAYRSGSEEPVREARVADLLPATRQQLRYACESSAVLASTRPPWVGSPRRWLLAGSALLTLLLLLLENSFAPTRSPYTNEIVRAEAGLTGLVCGVFLLRSLVLRREGLLQGVYLFASGLIEIRGGRVRSWPISRLHTVEQQGQSVVIDLGTREPLHLRTERTSLVDSLEKAHERLMTGEIAQDEWRIAPHDPLLFERERGAPWHEIEATVQPGSTSRARSWGLTVLGALLGLVVSLLAVDTKLKQSDRLFIATATQHDLDVLSWYVRQGGTFAEQADRAQLTLSTEEDMLIKYLSSPSARQPAEASRRLTDLALRRHLTGRTDLTTPIAVLTHALADNLREPTHRASVEHDLFRLRAARSEELFKRLAQQADSTACVELGDPLRSYFIRKTPHTIEAQDIRRRQFLWMASHCQSLGALEAARSMSHTPEQLATVEQAWRDFFAPRTARVPGPLGAQIDALRAYLAAHPQLPVQSPHLAFPAWSNALGLDESGATSTEGTPSWVPMVAVIGQTAISDGRRRLVDRLRESFSPEVLDWMVQPEGPRMQISWIDSSTDAVEQLAEVSLTLPGQSMQKVRFRFRPD